jgi:hypothetical protein
MSHQDFPSKSLFRIGMGLSTDDVNVADLASANKVHISQLQPPRKAVRTVQRGSTKGCSFPNKDFFLSGLGLLSDDVISSSHDFQFDCDVQKANNFAEKVRVAKDIVLLPSL